MSRNIENIKTSEDYDKLEVKYTDKKVFPLLIHDIIIPDFGAKTLCFDTQNAKK